MKKRGNVEIAELLGVELQCGNCNGIVIVPPGGVVPIGCLVCRQRLFSNEQTFYAATQLVESLKSVLEQQEKDKTVVRIAFSLDNGA